MHPAPPLLRLLAPLVLAPFAAADVVTIEPTLDNTLYESQLGTLSNGKGTWIFSGVTAQGFLRRALLQFDVAGVVPAGSTILSAELTLRMTMTIAGDAEVGLHRVLAAWGEGSSNAPGQEGSGAVSTTGDATWIHTFYNNTFWSTTGGDYDPTPSATLTVGSNGFYTFGSPGLAADVQSWLDAPGTSFGWLVRNVDELQLPSAKRFASRHHVDALSRPALRIVYEPPGSCVSTSYCLVNPNSTGNPAILSFSGSCSIAFGNFTLTAQPVPNQSFLFFFGPNQIQIPFGNGFLCAGGGLTRLNPPTFAQANVASRSFDLATFGATPGTQNFQCWFRDPMGGGSAFNTSDAIQITLIP